MKKIFLLLITFLLSVSISLAWATQNQSNRAALKRELQVELKDQAARVLTARVCDDVYIAEGQVPDLRLKVFEAYRQALAMGQSAGAMGLRLETHQQKFAHALAEGDMPAMITEKVMNRLPSDRKIAVLLGQDERFQGLIQQLKLLNGWALDLDHPAREHVLEGEITDVVKSSW